MQNGELLTFIETLKNVEKVLKTLQAQNFTVYKLQ